MTTLQEQFERDLEKGYLDKRMESISILSKYHDSNFTNYDLDLREYKNLKSIDLSSNNLASLDLSECKELKEIWSYNNNLTSLDLSKCKGLQSLNLSNNNLTSLKLPLSWIEKRERTWKKIRDNTKPKIPGLEKLIDTSDLDNWIKNYDESKAGDIEYHKFCGNKAGIRSPLNAKSCLWFTRLDYGALDNLGNKVIARKLIVLARLLTPAEDLAAGKLQVYEEKMNELAEGWLMCGSMNLPGRIPNNPWTEQEQQAVINQAINGDLELLSKLQDLPYLKKAFKIPSSELKEKLRQEIKAKVKPGTRPSQIYQQLREERQQQQQQTETIIGSLPWNSSNNN